MPRIFHIEPSHRRIISKSTLLKVLTYLDENAVETPALLMDTSQVRAKARAIGSSIERSKVFYAFKANPDPAVVSVLEQEGLGFEIASEGELRVLKNLGTAPGRIISSNPVKTFKFMREAADYGLKLFSFDSEEEIKKIASHVPDAEVYVRLSVPNEGSEWPLSRKFAVEFESAVDLLEKAGEAGLKPVGITFHVGSQCTNLQNWSTALYKARVLWDMATSRGLKLDLLNLGGGYPVQYTREVVQIEAIEQKVDELLKELFPSDIRIHLEPGRAMVGDAGIYVSTVHGKARRGEENWLYIDVGVFNGLMEAVGGIRYSYIFERGLGRRRHRRWTVAGPSCDSFDVIESNVELPEPETGSLCLILSAGAYTTAYASEFNGFSLPKTILI